MLALISTMNDLDFRALVHVYRANTELFGNVKNDAYKLLSYEQNFYQYLNEVFFATPGAQYAVWCVEGAYLSALRLEPYRGGLLITALETAPEVRNRGYATKLLKAVLVSVRTSGCNSVYAHIDKRNDLSLRTHKKCGFTVISDSARLLDGSFLPTMFTLCSSIE